MFLMHQNWFESALFVFSMDHFFLAYIVNEKMFASNFQRKTWKSRLWLFIQKIISALAVENPVLRYITIPFLDNPSVCLGLLMMMMMTTKQRVQRPFSENVTW